MGRKRKRQNNNNLNNPNTTIFLQGNNDVVAAAKDKNASARTNSSCAYYRNKHQQQQEHQNDGVLGTDTIDYPIITTCTTGNDSDDTINDTIFSEKDIQEQFINKGYIVLQNAFSSDLAARARDIIWDYLQKNHSMQKDNPDTWIMERQGIPYCFTEKDGSPWTEILQSQRLKTAIHQLCGRGGPDNSWEQYGLGWWVIGFPGFYSSANDKWGPAGRWHIDGSHYRHYLHSRESGLLPLFLFSTIEQNAGGTALWIGSHKVTAQVLYDVGTKGISGGDLSRTVYQRIMSSSTSQQQMRVEQVIGTAGDVILCHPLLLHARSKNLAPKEEKYVRFLCNPGIQLSKPKNIILEWETKKNNVTTSKDGINNNNNHNNKHSPVEQAIINAIRKNQNT